MLKRLSVVSLGCPKNLVDTENMLGMLGEAGFEPGYDEKNSDVILINTCGFIEAARTEAYGEIERALRVKRRHPAIKVVVAGCLVTRQQRDLIELYPEVDGFIGVHDVHRVKELLNEVMENKRPSFLNDSTARLQNMPRMLSTPSHLAYLKISEGCDNRCAYCAIPLIRGGMISRDAADIVLEAEGLVKLGVREVVLVAQDPTRFGLDTHGRHLLPELVRRIGQISELVWIRIMYAHPGRADVAADALRASPRVARYLDMPVQHGSDRMLAAMGRPGSRAEYLKQIRLIRESIPGISLRTTYMVGFPGETDKDFGELLGFIEEARFEHAGVFIFSPEDGTRAAEAAQEINSDIARDRYDIAMKHVQQVSRTEHERRIGTECQMLIERVGRTALIGRTEFQAPDIDGITRIVAGSAATIPGSFLTVRLVSVADHDFTAEIVDPA